MADFHQHFDISSWIPGCIFSGLCELLIVSALIFLIYSFYLKPETKPQIRPKIQYYSILSLTSFLIALIFLILYVIYVKFPTGTLNRYTESFTSYFTFFWSLGYVFTYLLFYHRLYQSFKETPHKVTKCSSVIFYALLFSYFVSQNFSLSLWLVWTLEGRSIAWKFQHFNDIYYPSLWTRFAIDFVLNIFVVYLFCSKIYKLTVLNSKFATEHSPKVFETMVKYFLLTVITVLSTEIFAISEIILSIAINHAIKTGEFGFYYTSYYIYFNINTLDAIISTIYVVITFPFAKKYYYKYCGCMHDKCVHIWTKSMTEEVADIELSIDSVSNDISQTNMQ